MLDMLEPGDLAIVLADDVPGVIEMIRPHAAPGTA